MTDIDQELEALYRNARAQEAPTQADRRAVRVAVATALAASTVATSAQAVGGLAASQAATGLGLGKLALWVCGGVALGVGLAQSASVVSSTSAVAPASSAPAGPATRPAGAQSAAARVTAEVVPAPPASGVVSLDASEPLRAPPVVAHGVGRASGASVSLGPARPSLLAESDGVQRIQQALASGKGSHALAVLAEQDAQFRGGALAEERAALRVLALCATGQVEAANAARQRFLGVYPHSPHAARVRDDCSP